MKKKLLTERFQQLAGIKPLYTEQSDTDDYGRSISGKDKRTFMEPEDSMPAARAEKMLDNQPTFLDDESMDELLDIILKYVEDPDDAYDELDRFEDGGFDALSNMVAANLDRDPEYKAWYNKLHSIQEPEDLRLEPEDDYVDEVELEDLDFKTLKAAFPKFYQKVKFTRTQPNGEEGPYYEDAITFPNADDSQTLIADESSLEDWKAKTLKRFGNVEIEFNDEAENWFDRVTILDDAFADAEAGFTKGKQDFIDKERELGRSID